LKFHLEDGHGEVQTHLGHLDGRDVMGHIDFDAGIVS
jgi:hypothetical protein